MPVPFVTLQGAWLSLERSQFYEGPSNYRFGVDVPVDLTRHFALGSVKRFVWDDLKSAGGYSYLPLRHLEPCGL